MTPCNDLHLLPFDARDVQITTLQSRIDMLERELEELQAPGRERNFMITGCATVIAAGLASYLVSAVLGLPEALTMLLWCVILPAVSSSVNPARYQYGMLT
jgi:hypothetical protein